MFIDGTIGHAKPTNMQTYKAGHLLPVLSAKELLATGPHHGLLAQTRDLAGLPDHYFETLYEALINHFAEFVQVLPTQNNGMLNGLLNQSLARAMKALQNFLLEHTGEPADPLLNYAVFTAALLTDVSKVIINQKIAIVDENGVYIDHWRPYEGSLLGRAEYYKIYPIAPLYQRLEHSITPLLARQLLPEIGFL